MRNAHHIAAAALLILPFLAIDATFLGANLLKVAEGGWMPLVLGGVVMAVMYTWRRGSRALFEKTRKTEVPLDSLVKSLERKPPARVPGTAVFLTGTREGIPHALLHNLKHNKVLHERLFLLSFHTSDAPYVDKYDRLELRAVEPKRIYRAAKGDVPEDDYVVPLGKAAISREGKHVTVVAWGAMLYEALAAAEQAAEQGVECEVIDLRTLWPLDIDTIV